MSVFAFVRAAGATPAVQSFNDGAPTMGLSTNDVKVVFATDSDPTTAPSRVVQACRESGERNGEARRESVLPMCVHAEERDEPSCVSELSPTTEQVDRTRERTPMSRGSKGARAGEQWQREPCAKSAPKRTIFEWNL